jgi:hypothetical protein
VPPTDPRPLRQVEIQKTHPNGTQAVIVCWLDADPRLKVGRQILLKDGPEGWWTVTEIYDVRQPKDIKRDWRVGGL